MSLGCRLRMHRPGEQRVFHRGHAFTRCEDCDTTLIDFGRGWRLLPVGKRVIWQNRKPEDQFFAIVPNYDRRRLWPAWKASLRGLAGDNTERVSDYRLHISTVEGSLGDPTSYETGHHLAYRSC